MSTLQADLNKSSICCVFCGSPLVGNDDYLVCTTWPCRMWGKKLEKSKKKDHMEEKDDIDID